MAAQGSKKIKRIAPKQATDKSTRVLYVEDAAVIRDTVARLLALRGYKVAYAKNGKEGVEMARKWNPDVVLMDLRMPVMDGYHAIKQIKLNPATKLIPVFVITAWSSRRERSKAKLAGADEFFVKPPDLDQLTKAIDQAVSPSKT
jgi:CheY-like chemotaxis protein